MATMLGSWYLRNGPSDCRRPNRTRNASEIEPELHFGQQKRYDRNARAQISLYINLDYVVIYACNIQYVNH